MEIKRDVYLNRLIYRKHNGYVCMGVTEFLLDAESLDV
jgi:hypothetical protein